MLQIGRTEIEELEKNWKNQKKNIKIRKTKDK